MHKGRASNCWSHSETGHPLFVDKLARLSDHLDRQLEACKTDPIKMYILSRDQASFKTLFFSGDRPGDLGQVRTNEILRFPNDDGLLFNHTWGKTLHGDRSNLFGIRRCANVKICPVAAIKRYMATTRAMQVDLTDGFLFRPTTAQGAISPLSISSEAMNSRLKTYLKEAGIDEGETAHSFRSGCAITLALSGSALADVMSHVGWERSLTASYYMQLEKVLRHDSTSALLTEGVDGHNTTSDLTRLYQNLNSVKNFVQEFPTEETLKRKASSETTSYNSYECDFNFLSNVRFGIKFWERFVRCGNMGCLSGEGSFFSGLRSQCLAR